MDANLLQSIGYGAGLIILGGITAYREWTRRKDQARERGILAKYGLDDNPTRCADHAEDIKLLKQYVGEMKTDIAVIKTRLDTMLDDIEELKDRVQ